MRLSLCFVALCVSSLPAHADTYAINFASSTAGQTTPTGEFTFDGSNFNSFIVSLDGLSFDFTAQANQGFVNPPINPAAPLLQCQFRNTFDYLSGLNGCTPSYLSEPVRGTSEPNPIFYFFESEFPGFQNVSPASSVAEVISSSEMAQFPYTSGTIMLTDLSTAQPSSVSPEPSTLALIGTGLLSIVGVNRKRFS